jgi:hypothetical protein
LSISTDDPITFSTRLRNLIRLRISGDTPLGPLEVDDALLGQVELRNVDRLDILPASFGDREESDGRARYFRRGDAIGVHDDATQIGEVGLRHSRLSHRVDPLADQRGQARLARQSPRRDQLPRRSALPHEFTAEDQAAAGTVRG